MNSSFGTQAVCINTTFVFGRKTTSQSRHLLHDSAMLSTYLHYFKKHVNNRPEIINICSKLVVIFYFKMSNNWKFIFPIKFVPRQKDELQ